MYILRLVPKSILMAGAAGIGVFIAFVGAKDMGVIVGAPFPTLLGLNTAWPYSLGEPRCALRTAQLSQQLCFPGVHPGLWVCLWAKEGGASFVPGCGSIHTWVTYTRRTPALFYSSQPSPLP
jgi:AGZA family xanthine/uracil permease-like MFS transporter